MPVPKKPIQQATNPRRARLPILDVRRRIWEQACDLVATGEARDLSGVLANRFNTSNRIIGVCLVLEGMRHERVAAALKNGVVSALHLAREAGEAVDVEIGEVA